jgi:hypothetical protein
VQFQGLREEQTPNNWTIAVTALKSDLNREITKGECSRNLKIVWRPKPGVIAAVTSANNVPIRLTEERWFHIMEYHRELEAFQSEILLAIANSDRLYFSPPSLEPNFAAVKVFARLVEFGLARNLVVHYREVSPSNGFILTALVMSDKRLNRRFKLWQRLK